MSKYDFRVQYYHYVPIKNNGIDAFLCISNRVQSDDPTNVNNMNLTWDDD